MRVYQMMLSILVYMMMLSILVYMILNYAILITISLIPKSWPKGFSTIILVQPDFELQVLLRAVAASTNAVGGRAR
jgi:hypothetical protein